jgi:hypothetical protein
MGAARKLQTEYVEEATPDFERRLGDPATLAMFAAEQYQDRSFFGRHPILTFLIGPIPLLFAGATLLSVLVSGFGFAIESANWISNAAFGQPLVSFAEEEHPYVQAISLALMSWAAIVFPLLLAAWILSRIAARNAVPWKWPAMACGILAAVAGVSWVSYQIKTMDRPGTFMVGFQLNASIEWFLMSFLPKFALALAIGLLLIHRSQQRALVAEA